MCNFLSVIVLKNLDIIWDPGYPDRHEELIKKHNLVDDEKGFYLEKFCRVEFIPRDPTKNLNDIHNWNLSIDESNIPEWLSVEMITNKLWTIISGMFVQDKRETLQDGCYILLDGAEVKDVNNCRIQYMTGNSKVEAMRGSSKVWVMKGNSEVETMRGSSKVGVMWENSKVGVMWENSKVETMWDNSKVGVMWENSKVEAMMGSSKVETMMGNSKVETMWENSKVGVMWENSKVETMMGNSKVETMWENSKVDKRIRKAWL